ncbi:hypothetical protein P153DRAFT_431827 [Dothidotthia symphoricarpi CBS 119687]|uniref:RING-type domain-containing protein n=1 Tax=Dothidotthia symphoricarpi CBS 119687 TaxID=1392245 RepID=A0A6A6AAQ8_9PLEO|nr:uncharacterized protein P153DRAFT_431827 [Dothidotthia symphoricarpi CBS 119687]KAF2129012.1 hypothetical protein P153DRAFT_431827 [Dothidotthia symphoricarpi CBS 119687]
MSTDTPLFSREDYIKALAPVAICSASNHCPICQEEYNDLHTPVLLPGCGHIFGRTCIHEWLKGDANTCPLDRSILFLPQMQSDSDESHHWSLIPHSFPGPAHATRRTRRDSGQDNYMFSSGEIIGVNGALTQEGCCHTVRDLWHQTGFFFRQASQRVDDLDVFAIDESLLIGQIRGVLPLGIQIPDEAWPMLIGIVRTMLVWHHQAWEDRWPEGRIAHEEVWRFAEDLWMSCGGDAVD